MQRGISGGKVRARQGLCSKFKPAAAYGLSFGSCTHLKFGVCVSRPGVLLAVPAYPQTLQREDPQGFLGWQLKQFMQPPLPGPPSFLVALVGRGAFRAMTCYSYVGGLRLVDNRLAQ